MDSSDIIATFLVLGFLLFPLVIGTIAQYLQLTYRGGDDDGK